LAGFVLGQLSDLRTTFKKAGKGETASFANKIDVQVLQGRVHHLRLTASQDQIIAGLADGTILVYDAKAMSTKVLFYSAVYRYKHARNLMTYHL
jgi:hypothetical protein